MTGYTEPRRPAPLHARQMSSRAQVVAACKHIARYIRTHALTVGDTLPPQDELRRTLGFSHNTLSPAMRLLVDLGLITRSNGSGTVVRDLEPLNRLTWTVGVAGIDFPIHGAGSYYTWLFHALLSGLSKMNCACHTYFRVHHPHWPEHAISDFPGLASDVEDGTIDGLVSLVTLDAPGRSAMARAGIPFLYVGIREEMPLAVLPDCRGMIADAVAALLGRGARRLALVGAGNFMDAPAFGALVRRLAGQSAGNALVTEVDPVGGASIEAGARVARALAERPAGRRPEAVIFVEDFAAAGAVREWGSHGGYAPHLAVLANKQLPQLWPRPVLRYEVDIDELAARGVRTLQEALLNPALPPKQERVRARLADG